MKKFVSRVLLVSSRIIDDALRRGVVGYSRLMMVAVDTKGQPLDVGRKTRAIPSAIRRALALRDRGCRFPGCTHTRHVDAHHIEHWFHGGKTKLDNLVSLCSQHHRGLHEGGYTIEVAHDGELVFLNSKGHVINAVPPVQSISSEPIAMLDARNRAIGVHIDARTGLTCWDGRRPDFDACVAAADVGGSVRMH